MRIRTLRSFSFFENINYVINDYKGSIVFAKYEKILLYERLSSIINNLCLIHLTSYSSYCSSLREVLDFKYKMPLVLDLNTIFIMTKSIRSFDNILINYNNIANVSKKSEGIEIIFLNKDKLVVPISLKSYYNLIKKIEIIKKYIISKYK